MLGGQWVVNKQQENSTKALRKPIKLSFVCVKRETNFKTCVYVHERERKRDMDEEGFPLEQIGRAHV